MNLQEEKGEYSMEYQTLEKDRHILFISDIQTGIFGLSGAG